MDRITIEKAADVYADKAPKSYCNGYYGKYAIADAFEEGANWRINSVWQKPSAYGDELKRDVEVIAKTKRGYRFGKFDVVGCFHEYIAFVSTASLEYALSDVLEYAYLDDLIPDRKEDWQWNVR